MEETKKVTSKALPPNTRGERLKQLREERRLKQREVADLIHVHVKHYSAMENNKREVTRETAHLLADVFYVDEKWILCETDFRNAEERHEHYSQQLNGAIGQSFSRDKLVHDLIEAHGFSVEYSDRMEGNSIVTSVLINGSNGDFREMSLSEYAAFRQKINDVVRGLLLVEMGREKEKRAWHNNQA